MRDDGARGVLKNISSVVVILFSGGREEGVLRRGGRGGIRFRFIVMSSQCLLSY